MLISRVGGKSTAFTHYAVFRQTDLRALAIVYKPVPHTAMGERGRVCQLNMLDLRLCNYFQLQETIKYRTPKHRILNEVYLPSVI